jgi:nucleotide-binding universal stress UspA family protein
VRFGANPAAGRQGTDEENRERSRTSTLAARLLLEDDMPPLKRLLVGVDFEASSLAALDWAIELASQLGATVTAMHIVEVPIAGVPDGFVVASPEFAAELTRIASKTLEGAIALRRERGVPLSGLIRQGTAWETIHEVAKELDVDLIVLGTHGRRGILHALLGSVAEKTIRTATRPVVVAHAPV